jgi:hypothetical protein
MPEKDSIHSTLRERIVEHVFMGEALRTLWRLGITDVEMLRSEFDAHGYDLVHCRGAIVRHIQFKTQREGNVSTSLSLAEKPSGCVIWVGIDECLNFKTFRWLGGLPGQPLPDIRDMKVSRRQTHNKAGIRPDRPNHRKIPKRAFETTMEDVLRKLFGELTP